MTAVVVARFRGASACGCGLDGGFSGSGCGERSANGKLSSLPRVCKLQFNSAFPTSLFVKDANHRFNCKSCTQFTGRALNSPGNSMATVLFNPMFHIHTPNGGSKKN